MNLTPKQIRFCEEYLIDLNGTQAAIRAGYSKKTANEQSARMLANVSIQEYVQELKTKRSERTEITQDMVLKEYARIAFLDPRKLFDENDNLIPLTKLDEDTARAIAGIDHTTVYDKKTKLEETTKKIKLTDKKGALDSVARHLGMFNDKLTIENPRERKQIKLPDGTEIDI